MTKTAGNIGFAARLAGHWSNGHFIAVVLHLGWTNIVGLLFVNLYFYIFNQQRFRADTATIPALQASPARWLLLYLNTQLATTSKKKMILFNFTSKTLFWGLSAIILASCNQTTNENNKIDKIDTLKKVVNQVETKIANSDTLIIDQTCAVIISADSLQIAKRKKELGQDFYVGADDYAFYLNETQEFLDSVKLKTVDCNGKKILKFIYADKKQELINLTNLDELWKVYLFDPTKKSKSVDMTMIDEEYKNYFK